MLLFHRVWNPSFHKAEELICHITQTPADILLQQRRIAVAWLADWYLVSLRNMRSWQWTQKDAMKRSASTYQIRYGKDWQSTHHNITSPSSRRLSSALQYMTGGSRAIISSMLSGSVGSFSTWTLSTTCSPSSSTTYCPYLGKNPGRGKTWWGFLDALATEAFFVAAGDTAAICTACSLLFTIRARNAHNVRISSHTNWPSPQTRSASSDIQSFSLFASSAVSSRTWLAVQILSSITQTPCPDCPTSPHPSGHLASPACQSPILKSRRQSSLTGTDHFLRKWKLLRRSCRPRPSLRSLG